MRFTYSDAHGKGFNYLKKIDKIYTHHFWYTQGVSFTSLSRFLPHM
jgi:hypothetical protein